MREIWWAIALEAYYQETIAIMPDFPREFAGFSFAVRVLAENIGHRMLELAEAPPTEPEWFKWINK